MLIFEGLLALTNISSVKECRQSIIKAGVWDHISEHIGGTTKQNDAQDDIRLAACELMANLALCEEVQQMGREGKLTYESQLLRSVLKYVGGDRPLLAILGFFANVDLDKAPEDLTTVVFKAMASSQNEGVWHRALYVLTEYEN